MSARLSMFDSVRVLDSAETRSAGIAGRFGSIYGWTTPSITAVTVIGGANNDCAFNVQIEELNQSFWLNDDLLEFIDHAPGTEIQIDGSAIKSVRKADGQWQDVPSVKAPTGRIQSILKWLWR